MVAWSVAAVHALDVGNLESAIGDVWDRVAFLTRYTSATLTEVLTELDRADTADYIAAVGRIIKQENAARDGK